jgi:hypothetical protein
VLQNAGVFQRLAGDGPIADIVEDDRPASQHEEIVPARRQLSWRLKARFFRADDAVDVAVTEQAVQSRERAASPDERQAVDARVRLGILILRHRQLALLVLKLDQRSRHLQGTVAGSRHRAGVAHRIEYRTGASGAHMERDAWLDPEILLTGEPHAAAEQECRFLPLGKGDP